MGVEISHDDVVTKGFEERVTIRREIRKTEWDRTDADTDIVDDSCD